eukprot:7681294-Alexandrium_andersonii.AAC.1
MKLMPVQKPVVVNRPPGDVQIVDLPIEFLNVHGGKRHRFMDILSKYEGALDLKQLEAFFVQGRYEDLPEPVRMKS